MRTKPNVEIVDHIGYVEQNNNQLTNMNEPMLEHVIIYKIFMHLAWDNIPHYEQTLKSLMLQLFKEEN
jgi:hypothetical protein